MKRYEGLDGWTVAVIGPEKGRREFVGWNADRKVIEGYARHLRANWQASRLTALRPTSIRVRRINYDAWLDERVLRLERQPQ